MSSVTNAINNMYIWQRPDRLFEGRISNEGKRKSFYSMERLK